MGMSTAGSTINSRRRWATCLIAMGATSAAIVGLILPWSAATADECGNGGLIVVTGANDPDAVNLQGLESNPNNAGYKATYVKYPTTIWPLGSVGYNDDVERGATATKQAVGSYQQACPGKPVKIVGYSLGARVAGDVLSDIGNDRDDKVDVNNTPDDPTDDVDITDEGVSGELYADPRQDGTIEGRGIEQSLIGVIPGFTMSGRRAGGFGSLAGRVVSVCDAGDAICDLPDPVRDPIGAIDSLLGFFTKHLLYPAGFATHTPEEWAGGPAACHDAGSGGLVCVKKDDSAFIGLVKQVAVQVGIPANTVDEIPDIVDWRPRMPGDFLPGLSISHLQPLIRLVEKQLPQLPNLTYNAGGYLPDAFVFTNIADGILKLDSAKFNTGVTELAKSLASIALIPVNVPLYWGKRLINVGPGPYLITPAAPNTPNTTPFARTTAASTFGSPTTNPKPADASKVTDAITSLTSKVKSPNTSAPSTRALTTSAPNTPTTNDATPRKWRTPWPKNNNGSTGGSTPAPVAPKSPPWQGQFNHNHNGGGDSTDSTEGAAPKPPTFSHNFGRSKRKSSPGTGQSTQSGQSARSGQSAQGGQAGGSAGGSESGGGN